MAGQRLELIPGSRGEGPLRGIVVLALGIGSQEFRRVVFRVEGDGEESEVFRGLGLAGQSFLGSSEEVGHPRTEVGIGAAGEDEGEGQDLTPKVRQPDHLPQFIGQRVVGQHRSGLEQGHRRGDADRGCGGRGVGVGAEHLDAVDPSVVGGDEHAEGDPVSGFESLEFLGLLHVEGHGHGGHEAGDFVVLDHHRPPFGFHPPNHAADGVFAGRFFRGCPGRSRSGGLLLAADQAEGDEHGREPGEPLHAESIVNQAGLRANGEDSGGEPPEVVFRRPWPRRSPGPGPSPRRPSSGPCRCCGCTRPACPGGRWG